MGAPSVVLVKAIVPGAATVSLESSLVRSDEPTRAQAEAGNYAKRLLPWRGLTIRIENEAGSVRRGTDPGGQPWESAMALPYGYFVESMGVDGDPVDVYVGPLAETAEQVFVVHQRRVGDWKKFDEDKAFIGLLSEDEARAAFLQHYDDPRFLGPITAMPVDEFVAKVRATKETPKMIKSVSSLPILFLKARDRRDTSTVDMFAAPGTHMETITRKDGVVQRHVVANAKKDAALSAAVAHLKEDAHQKDLPAAERAEDKKLVAKLEGARGGDAGHTQSGAKLNRMDGSTLIEKLDRGYVTVKEAKDFARRFRVELEGRTKEQVIRSISRNMEPPSTITAQAPSDVRVTSTSDLADGTTIKDGKGKLYRVHYQRNHLVIAHPIENGKPQVSADTSVRFWVSPDRSPSSDNDRTDPIYPVTEKAPAEDLEKFIKVAADSVGQLRKVDVMRVLESNGTRKKELARYITEKRPDLAQEVKEVMEDEFGIHGYMAKSIPAPRVRCVRSIS